jgi:hypothetical protein
MVVGRQAKLSLELRAVLITFSWQLGRAAILV